MNTRGTWPLCKFYKEGGVPAVSSKFPAETLVNSYHLHAPRDGTWNMPNTYKVTRGKWINNLEIDEYSANLTLDFDHILGNKHLRTHTVPRLSTTQRCTNIENWLYSSMVVMPPCSNTLSCVPRNIRSIWKEFRGIKVTRSMWYIVMRCFWDTTKSRRISILKSE